MFKKTATETVNKYSFNTDTNATYIESVVNGIGRIAKIIFRITR